MFIILYIKTVVQMCERERGKNRELCVRFVYFLTGGAEGRTENFLISL